jgi:FKBP-type peptidyl-prolyl cis-trans isomerase
VERTRPYSTQCLRRIQATRAARRNKASLARGQEHRRADENADHIVAGRAVERRAVETAHDNARPGAETTRGWPHRSEVAYDETMRRAVAVAVGLLVVGSLAACTLKDDSSNASSSSSSTPAAAAAPAAGAIPAPPDVAKAPDDAKTTASGIGWRVLKPGTGSIHPTATSTVTVHYTGWTPDGKMFDSSVARNEPATFRLDEVVRGWTEGVQLMVIGERRRFWIPGKLGYDEIDRPGAPKGMLVFDIELLDIK